MNYPPARAPAAEEVSLTPRDGWHCLHAYYRFDRESLARISKEDLASGRREFAASLDPDSEEAPVRLQSSLVSGHKADFGIMMLDPDPLKIDAVHQRLLATKLGAALEATYSYVSMTEVSEYAPSVEQYAQKLIEGGDQEGSPAFQAKVKAYSDREPMMRRQRLTPDLPPWPVACFYPMNKKRVTGENWYTLSFEQRSRMMSEHARSGMAFAGRVTQLITVGVGLDDWEWGVTLWARSPDLLKDIVYRMRFDEASARYAEFGPFYTSYVATPEDILRHCRITG